MKAEHIVALIAFLVFLGTTIYTAVIGDPISGKKPQVDLYSVFLLTGGHILITYAAYKATKSVLKR